MHLAEPGCAVTEAELERHEHYVKFLAEVKVRRKGECFMLFVNTVVLRGFLLA